MPTTTCFQSAIKERPAGRALAFIDAENLLGEAHSHPIRRRGLLSVQPAWEVGHIRATRALLHSVAHLRDGDLTIGATNHIHRGALPMVWQAGCWLDGGHGKDAADRALVQAMAEFPNYEQVGRVVLGSGDGYYAMMVRALRSRGMHVDVVARDGSLSRLLANEASAVHLLPAHQLRRAA